MKDLLFQDAMLAYHIIMDRMPDISEDQGIEMFSV